MRLALLTITLLLTLTACGDDTETIGDGPDKVVVGGDTPDGFPEDFPLPDGARFETASAGNYQFTVDASPRAIAGELDGLPGWKVDSTGNDLVDGDMLDVGFVATWDEGTVTSTGGEDVTIMVVSFE